MDGKHPSLLDAIIHTNPAEIAQQEQVHLLDEAVVRGGNSCRPSRRHATSPPSSTEEEVHRNLFLFCKRNIFCQV
jgi:hypothetical protein